MGECRRTVEQLAPYLDGGLSQTERADVERHLGTCPPCRRVATAATGGRAVLRERSTLLRDTPLPPGLRSRCEALARQSHAPQSWRQRWLPALAVAALVLATGLAVLALETRRSGALLAYQMTLDHVKCDHLFTSDGMKPMEARDATITLARAALVDGDLAAATATLERAVEASDKIGQTFAVFGGTVAIT